MKTLIDKIRRSIALWIIPKDRLLEEYKYITISSNTKEGGLSNEHLKLVVTNIFRLQEKNIILKMEGKFIKNKVYETKIYYANRNIINI